MALGVFDGVHRGHRNILEAAVRKARSVKGTSLVLTFWPHPQKEGSLYSLEHRLRLIEGLGIDVCIVVNFSRSFAKISAVDFIKDILIKKIQAHYIFVGKNFRFGKAAKGDFQTLHRLSGIYNFKVKAFKIINSGGRPISSTYIRQLIKRGDLIAAQKLLSRPVSVLGTVIKGDSLGRKLGFPTANINPHHEVTPPQGVYAVQVIFHGRKFQGICYIGTRPTLQRQKAKRIEVYIFNFTKSIYCEYLEIQFIKKVRSDRKFSSLKYLIEQIKEDSTLVQGMFSHH